MGLKLANGTRARLGCQAKAAMLLLATLTLAACNGPPDQPLVTSGTQDEYRASLDPLLPKMSKHELEAFDWAVSDFDLTKLHSKYPGASPRKIIRSEVREVLDTYPERVKALEEIAAEEAPLRAELIKITAQNAEFVIEKNFFGLQPVIRKMCIRDRSSPAPARSCAGSAHRRAWPARHSTRSHGTKCLRQNGWRGCDPAPGSGSAHRS